jgi:TonB family protein
VILGRALQASGGSFLAAALCCALLGLARAQQTPDQPPEGSSAAPVSVETFRDPRPVSIPWPSYGVPSRAVAGSAEELQDAGDGWVTLSMMVDAQGKPFEVGVVRSTGNKRFEQLAVRVMERATFEPASLGGKPIPSVYEREYRFRQFGSQGARGGFIDGFKALQSACTADDRAAANAAMQKMSVTTLYEDAYYGMAQYLYASRWGDVSQQETGLWRAIAGQTFLSSADRTAILLANFKLQAQKHDYFQALRMGELLKKSSADPDLMAKLEPIIETIEQLRKGPAAYEMSGSIGENGAWFVHLFKHSFRAESASGLISQVKLRCTRGFYSFPFDAGLQYEVPDQYGECTLSLEGTPGTQLRLTQL